MISVCCCAINAKNEIDTFVRSLVRHNHGVNFEIVITHDDRVDDGSGAHLESLQKEFPGLQLKVVRHTNEMVLDYLERLLAYYEGKFPSEMVSALRKNLERYKHGDKSFVDPAQTFLWLSSGVLYNKAVAASSGDILIITPADFVYLFSLKRAEEEVAAKSKLGHYYSKPNALFARIGNQEKEWLTTLLNEVHAGPRAREGWRWDSQEPFRDYLKTPTKLSSLYLLNFYKPELICLDSDEFIAKAAELSVASRVNGGMQRLPTFHGFHVMTRKTYDHIGGFTEEFYGRAYADDKMTWHGLNSPAPAQTPDWMDVAWCAPYFLSACQAEYYPPGWGEKLPLIDPYSGRHPSSPCFPKYLHEGIFPSDGQYYEVVRRLLNPHGPVVRF